MLSIVNDRRDDGSVRHSRGERLAQMSRLARAARRDHGNRNSFTDAAGDLEIVTELGAVAIDRIDAQFAGAEPLALKRPCQRVAASRLASAVDHDFVAGRY